MIKLHNSTVRKEQRKKHEEREKRGLRERESNDEEKKDPEVCWSRGNKVLTTSTTASTTKMCNMKNFYNLILRTCLLPVVFHGSHTLTLSLGSQSLFSSLSHTVCMRRLLSLSLKSNLNSIHLTTHAHSHTHIAQKFMALSNLLFSFLEQMLFMCHMWWYKVRYSACSFFHSQHYTTHNSHKPDTHTHTSFIEIAP